METVPTPSTPGSVSLLDLSFLTKEERTIILHVLKADEALQKVEEENEGLESVDLVPIRMPPDSLYGSELIRKSLEASSQNETAGETVSVPSPAIKPQSTLQDKTKTQVKQEEKPVPPDIPSPTHDDGEATENVSNDPKDCVDTKEEEVPGKETTLNKPVEKKVKKHTRKHSVETPNMNSSSVTHQVQSKLDSREGVSSGNLDESSDTISPLTTHGPSASITRRGSDLSRKRHHSMQPNGTLASSRQAGMSMSMCSLPSQSRSASSGKLKHADSISSIGSMTALSRPSRGDYDITGDVQLAIEYKKKELLIHVKRARGLASSNAGSTFPDAYIKIYLLPDKSKHSKRKTDVKRKTANPVYKEILKYRLPKEELNARTIWLTVWDRDLFNTSKFIGEVSLPVASLDLSNPAPKWYKLQDYAQPSRVPPSAPTASSSQLAIRRGHTPLRIATQSGPQRRLMMEQTPMETRGMQIPQDPHHPTIIKGGPPTTMKGLRPASPKQQALQKITTVVRSTEYLPGFETIAEACFVITKSRAHTMEWKGYGIKLHIPEGALPAGHTECRVDIKAGLAGQFSLPGDSELISCVYWFSCPHKFLKPVTLEIQHCASLHDSSYSSSPQLVIAKCSQAELPYRFRTQMDGTFSPQSSFGSIQVSQLSDSIYGIIIDRMFRRCYCGHLYYTKKESNKWNVDFVISWNLPAYLKAIQSTYSSLAAVAGPRLEVHFQSDSISLELPEDGLVLPNGWAIRPLGPLVITKQQVNEFTPGQQTPCCQLQVKLEKDKKAVELEHKVKLLGAKKDFNFFTITCTPEENVTDSGRTAGGDKKLLGGSKQEDTTLSSTATPKKKGSVD